MKTSRREALQAVSALAGASLLASAPAAGDAAIQESVAATVNLFDFEPLARSRLPAMAWEYISGGAGDEVTLRWNRESYDRLRLRSRILTDISKLDTCVTRWHPAL